MNIFSNTYNCFWKLLEDMDCRAEYLSLRLHTVLNFLSPDHYFKNNYSQSVAYGIYRRNFIKVNEWFLSEISHIYTHGDVQPISTRYHSQYNKLSQTKVILFEGYLYTFVIVESDTTDIFIVLTGFQKFINDVSNEIDINYIDINIEPSFIVSDKPITYLYNEKIGFNMFKLDQYTYVNTYSSAISYCSKTTIELSRNILEYMVQQIKPYIGKTFLKTDKIMRVNGFLISCPSDNIILIVDYNPNPEKNNKNYTDVSGNSYVSSSVTQMLENRCENHITIP